MPVPVHQPRGPCARPQSSLALTAWRGDGGLTVGSLGRIVGTGPMGWADTTVPGGGVVSASATAAPSAGWESTDSAVGDSTTAAPGTWSAWPAQAVISINNSAAVRIKPLDVVRFMVRSLLVFGSRVSEPCGISTPGPQRLFPALAQLAARPAARPGHRRVWRNPVGSRIRRGVAARGDLWDDLEDSRTTYLAPQMAGDEVLLGLWARPVRSPVLSAPGWPGLLSAGRSAVAARALLLDAPAQLAGAGRDQRPVR